MKKRIHKKFLKQSNTLAKYEEVNGDNQKWVQITKIIVPSQYEKDELIKAFRYIHDLREVDCDYMAVNTLMHMYELEDRIEVQNE